MPRLSAAVINLSPSERETLEQLVNRHSTAQQIVLRAKIILLATNGKTHGDIAFTLEQITQLYAIACNPPEQYDRPISHWSSRELADELIKQSIVESISERHVGRLMEAAALKPHQSEYWLNPPDCAFQSKVENICQIYNSAFERTQQGELIVSLDEMTGIQALERTMPDIPMKPGRIVKREFEYKRNGTQSLIASFNVATGEIAHATVGPPTFIS